MAPYEFVVPDEYKGSRLDQFLVIRLPEYSRSRIQQMIKEGYVLVDGKPSKSHHKLQVAEKISLKQPTTSPLPSIIQPENIPLDIVYEDDSIIVINKPVGMVTHPAPGNWSGTLVNAVLGYMGKLDALDNVRPGIVHRLDRDTSGLLVVAKSPDVHLILSKQIKNRQMKRKYIALVKGVVEFDEGTVDAPIGRHPRNRKKMAIVYDTGRPAITHYRVLQRFSKHTLLELSLDTGRTHQIRVHMAHIGHPIINDAIYGHHSEGRMMLHAFYLCLHHPVNDKLMEFKLDIPSELKALINSKDMI